MCQHSLLFSDGRRIDDDGDSDNGEDSDGDVKEHCSSQEADNHNKHPNYLNLCAAKFEAMYEPSTPSFWYLYNLFIDAVICDAANGNGDDYMADHARALVFRCLLLDPAT